ncbi:MAG: ribonuclease H [Anaerolineales bacterium]
MLIYTDGSSLSHPRSGGIATRFITVDESGEEICHDIFHTGYEGATNNQMELQACIVALRKSVRFQDIARLGGIIIRTDSTYVSQNYKKAMSEWSRRRWLTQSGRPVLNADLWKSLLKEIRKTNCHVEIQWVKGHSKDPHNKAVDRMAKTSARSAFNPPKTLVHVRKKKTKESVEIGSVKLFGRISIRIITAEYLSVQRLWKLKYEVISKRSVYHGKVDIILVIS